MKKYTSIICTMAVLLMASAVTFVSCSKDEEPAVSGKFTLTVNASKGAPATKHLEEGEGNTIIATWKTGESVTVDKGETYLGRLWVTTEGSSTTLTGTIEGEFAVNDVLTLKFQDPIDEDYEQNGTLENIATYFDHAVATVTVTSISGSSITTTNAEFKNQQAIVKFTLQNMSHEDLYAQKLEVTVDGTTYTIDPDPEGDATANVLYVALPGFENKEVTLTATVDKDNDIYYTKTVSGITFVNAQYYTVTVGMTQVLPECSYTAPSLVSGTLTYNTSAQALVTGGSATNATIYYSTDGGTNWSTSATGTNAGNYTVYYKVVPNDGYAGGVESTLLGTKTINKANGTCSLSSTSSSGWMSYSSKSVNVTVANHGGNLSYSKSGGGGSQNLSVSFGGSGTSRTMTLSKGSGIAAGCYDVTVTVTCAETTNYKAASATYTCYE